MSLKNPGEVLAAVETLETSYSYEPARWMEAYRELRSLETEFEQQLRPYRWISIAFAIAGLIWFAALAISSFSRIGGEPAIENVWLDSLVSTSLWFAPVFLIWFGGWLTRVIAARRHPLLLHKPSIEQAMDRFRPLAGDPNPDDGI